MPAASFRTTTLALPVIVLALALSGCARTGSSARSILSDAAQHPATIYEMPAGAERSSEAFYTPFNLLVQPMERLILVNIEKDPDEVYIGFEPQVFDDAHTGTGMLVIAYRIDGRVDVYHQPGVRAEGNDYSIVGQGLAHVAERTMAGARLDITPTGVDLFFAFDDLTGRRIEVLLRESGKRPVKPFGLLAPLGYGTAKPPYLPVFLMHDFYFVRRKDTEHHILIDGRSHRLDRLPLPLDGQRMFFTRYSPAPLITGWNVTHDGPLVPLTPVSLTPAEGRVEHEGVTYELADNRGHREILRMRGGDGRNEVAINFRPALPDIGGLRDGAHVEGRFVITGDPSTGAITGDYRVERRGTEVLLTVHPSGGWTPNERRLILRFIYNVGRPFKNWPKDYVWQARVRFNDGTDPVMTAAWSRLSGAQAERALR
jgi:hypothetical protein